MILFNSSFNFLFTICQEIKKFVKERTREILGETEKLRTRVSSLEAENRNLKHKVKMLYKAIRAALKLQKKVRMTKA